MNLPLPEVEEIKPGIDQWQNKLYGQVNNPTIFARMWDSIPEPKRECAVYDWPENETR